MYFDSDFGFGSHEWSCSKKIAYKHEFFTDRYEVAAPLKAERGPFKSRVPPLSQLTVRWCVPGLSSLILDVKMGRAAFMQSDADARFLARSMVDAGNGAGVKTVAVLTTMNHPIGRMIGNALEVEESIDCMKVRSLR